MSYLLKQLVAALLPAVIVLALLGMVWNSVTRPDPGQAYAAQGGPREQEHRREVWLNRRDRRGCANRLVQAGCASRQALADFVNRLERADFANPRLLAGSRNHPVRRADCASRQQAADWPSHLARQRCASHRAREDYANPQAAGCPSHLVR